MLVRCSPEEQKIPGSLPGADESPLGLSGCTTSIEICQFSCVALPVAVAPKRAAERSLCTWSRKDIGVNAHSTYNLIGLRCARSECGVLIKTTIMSVLLLSLLQSRVSIIYHIESDGYQLEGCFIEQSYHPDWHQSYLHDSLIREHLCG